MTDAPLRGARVLVTGASGFIGGRLCRELEARGAEVHGVSRRPQPVRGAVRWWQTDLAVEGSARDLVARVRPDRVVHLASHVAGSRDRALVWPTFRDNLVATVHLLTAVADAGCARLVLAGSMEEPEPGPDPVPTPASPYAAAKAAASLYARLFRTLYAVPVVTARIFMVYGPGQRDDRKLVPYVIRSLRRGERPALSSGARPVDWVYVDDVVDGLVRLAGAMDLDADRVDLGSGVLVTVREVVTLLHELLGAQGPPAFGSLEDRPMEQVRVADVRRTAALLGWQPAVALRDGLERTIAWCRETEGR